MLKRLRDAYQLPPGEGPLLRRWARKAMFHAAIAAALLAWAITTIHEFPFGLFFAYLSYFSLRDNPIWGNPEWRSNLATAPEGALTLPVVFVASVALMLWGSVKWILSVL